MILSEQQLTHIILAYIRESLFHAEIPAPQNFKINDKYEDKLSLENIVKLNIKNPESPLVTFSTGENNFLYKGISNANIKTLHSYRKNIPIPMYRIRLENNNNIFSLVSMPNNLGEIFGKVLDKNGKFVSGLDAATIVKMLKNPAPMGTNIDIKDINLSNFISNGNIINGTFYSDPNLKIPKFNIREMEKISSQYGISIDDPRLYYKAFYFTIDENYCNRFLEIIAEDFHVSFLQNFKMQNTEKFSKIQNKFEEKKIEAPDYIVIPESRSNLAFKFAEKFAQKFNQKPQILTNAYVKHLKGNSNLYIDYPPGTDSKTIRGGKLTVKKFISGQYTSLTQMNTRDRKFLKNWIKPTNYRNDYDVVQKLEPTVIIIDDVLTTGTTISELKRQIEKEGAKVLAAVTIFRAPNLK